MEQKDVEGVLTRHFPELSAETLDRLVAYEAALYDWNQKINLVSRKDVTAFALHHIAHALAVTRKLKLMDGARLIDVGTGGGIPGIPLAIVYPGAHFTLTDSIAKKTMAVADIAAQLKLANVKVVRGRVEEMRGGYDFVLGRAVTALDQFVPLVAHLVRRGVRNSLSNGILYWKGGAWQEELAGLRGVRPRHVFALAEWVADVYFEGKYILHFDARDLGRFAPVRGGEKRNARQG